MDKFLKRSKQSSDDQKNESARPVPKVEESQLSGIKRAMINTFIRKDDKDDRIKMLEERCDKQDKEIKALRTALRDEIWKLKQEMRQFQLENYRVTPMGRGQAFFKSNNQQLMNQDHIGHNQVCSLS